MVAVVFGGSREAAIGEARKTKSRCMCLYLDKGGWLRIGHYTQVGAEEGGWTEW